MAAQDIICSVCGSKNPASSKRCASCGAKLEALGEGLLTAEEQAAKRYQQEGFLWKWAFVSFAIDFALAFVAFVILRFALSSSGYDPQGLPGIMMMVGIWFVGGTIVGVASPGKTFLEPAVGALLAMLPTVGWLIYIDEVARLSFLAYLVSGLIGVMVALIGAFLGERLQMGLRSSKA
jgi:4-amino-4-deoxy-L-arabinose transferase-like glycosyltransferase